MNVIWKIFGEAIRRWVPTQEVHASHAGGTTSGLCPSGALPPPPLPPSGPRPAFVSGAVPSFDSFRLGHEIRSSLEGLRAIWRDTLCR